MVSSSVTCNATGNSVALKVIISESVGRIAWVIRMYSSVDQGKGGDTGLVDYPYFVENINVTTNPYPDYYNTTKTYSKAGNYLAELALSGYGVVDQCAYTIGGTIPPVCTNPKYKCSGSSCVSDNCDGTGTLPAGCNNSCTGTTSYYKCDPTSKHCITNPGASSNLDGCTSFGQICGGTSTTCSGFNIPILGCQDKSTVYIAGVGILLLMMMKKGR